MKTLSSSTKNNNTKVKANNKKTSDYSLMWMGGISAFFFLFKWEIVNAHHIAHLCIQKILKICAKQDHLDHHLPSRTKS